MRIGMEQGTRKRVAEFNWTNNSDASKLVNEYRRAADQAILIFDITIARENQPLNAPKLMEVMESLVKRDGLSDPQQLLPLLQDLSTDEHVPLITRNHALRIIKKIRGKCKISKSSFHSAKSGGSGCSARASRCSRFGCSLALSKSVHRGRT